MVPRQRIERERQSAPGPGLVGIRAPPDAGGDLVVDRRLGVVKLHRTHSATVNAPRPPISVSASASRTRLRPRIASRPPWAAPALPRRRPSFVHERVDAVRGQERRAGHAPTAGATHRGELIERDLAGDVLRAEVDERRRDPGRARGRCATSRSTGDRPSPPSWSCSRTTTTRGATSSASRSQRAAASCHATRDPGSDVVADRRRAGSMGKSTSARSSSRRRPPSIPPPSARAAASGRLSSSSLASTTSALPGGGSDSRLTASGPSGNGSRRVLRLRRRDRDQPRTRARAARAEARGRARRAARPIARRARTATLPAHAGAAASTDRASVPTPGAGIDDDERAAASRARPTTRRAPGRRTAPNSGPTSTLVMKSPRRPARPPVA